jgi:hypothetical protein
MRGRRLQWVEGEHEQGYAFAVARTQQTFENGKDGPIYVSIEPWPECFELEPGDTLTLIMGRLGNRRCRAGERHQPAGTCGLAEWRP